MIGSINFLGLGIHARYIESIMQTVVTIVVIERRYSIAVELRDNTKENSQEAIGLATFSNSKSIQIRLASRRRGEFIARTIQFLVLCAISNELTELLSDDFRCAPKSFLEVHLDLVLERCGR